MKKPLVIGLTGGIGSGKSAAAGFFAELGATVIDTDAIARELTSAKGAAMPEIREAFGAAALAPDGSLDRAAMRERVFGDAAARKRLESILHPKIRAEAERRCREALLRSPYVVLVVPLLLESGGYRSLVDRIAVVDCGEETQIARVMSRSGFGRGEAEAIMAAQAGREARRAAADDLIENEGGLDHLRAQIRELDRIYRDSCG